MNNEIKAKLAKVYELINRGENGEKQAAKKALERLLKKYNLDESYINTMATQEYTFKYATNLDLMLISQLIHYFFTDKDISGSRNTFYGKDVVLKMEYLDFVQLESAYEYFRRHMRAEFNRVCLPAIKRCRSAKTKSKRRKELQELFFGKYVIASGIYTPDQVGNINPHTLSPKERKDRETIANVQGGKYNTQVNTGLYLKA